MNVINLPKFKFRMFDEVKLNNLNHLSGLKILKPFRDIDGRKLYNLKGTTGPYSILVYSVPEEDLNSVN